LALILAIAGPTELDAEEPKLMFQIWPEIQAAFLHIGIVL